MIHWIFQGQRGVRERGRAQVRDAAPRGQDDGGGDRGDDPRSGPRQRRTNLLRRWVLKHESTDERSQGAFYTKALAMLILSLCLLRLPNKKLHGFSEPTEMAALRNAPTIYQRCGVRMPWHVQTCTIFAIQTHWFLNNVGSDSAPPSPCTSLDVAWKEKKE